MPTIRMTTRSSMSVNPPSSFLNRCSTESSWGSGWSLASSAVTVVAARLPHRGPVALRAALASGLPLAPRSGASVLGQWIGTSRARLSVAGPPWTDGAPRPRPAPTPERRRGGPFGPPLRCCCAALGAWCYQLPPVLQPPEPPVVQERVGAPPAVLVMVKLFVDFEWPMTE